MRQSDMESIFGDGLDTFKAFENLTIDSSGANQEEFPMSVWQILNHLTIWQESQLNLLRSVASGKDIQETDTWIKERVPQNEGVLQKAVEKFNNQIEAIKAEIKLLPTEVNATTCKIIQQLSLHLSFHVGEVVVIRRIKGSYPLPHQMKEFLQQ